MKGLIIKISIMFLLFGAFGFYIYKSLPEIIMTLDTTTETLTTKMLVAIIVGIFSYALIVFNFQNIFNIFNIKKTYREMLKLDLSSLATSVVIPSFGIAGSLVFIEDATHKGYSKAKALAATTLYLATDYLVISFLLILNLILFSFSGFYKLQVLIPIIIFLILTFAVFYLIFLASSKKSKARLVLVKIIKPISVILKKILKNAVDPEIVAEKILNEFSITTEAVKKDPRHYFKSIFFALLTHLLRILSLFLVFMALGYQIGLWILMSGYIVGSVLIVISPTPNGIGFVEGGMVLIFTSLGVPANVAGTATIIYRGFSFWVPFFVGLFFVQTNQIKKLKEDIELINENV